MNAGRELDALVAERVMGLVAYSVGLVTERPRVRTVDDLQRTGTPLSPYSTDIAAAWQVVERLHALGFVVNVTMDNGTGRYCEVWKLADDSIYAPHRVEAETTIPHVICLAALKAVGAEVPNYDERETSP